MSAGFRNGAVAVAPMGAIMLAVDWDAEGDIFFILGASSVASGGGVAISDSFAVFGSGVNRPGERRR